MICKTEMNVLGMPPHIFCVILVSLPLEQQFIKKCPLRHLTGVCLQKESKKVLESYGFRVKYCAGNLNALKNEVSKGTPVIVFIKVRKDKRWLHYIPVVGYDEDNLFLAESVSGNINCNEKAYNRKIRQKEFLTLWNTAMLKMPFYTHTFYVIEQRTSSPKKLAD